MTSKPELTKDLFKSLFSHQVRSFCLLLTLFFPLIYANAEESSKPKTTSGGLVRSTIGQKVTTDFGGDLTITCIDQRRGFGKGETYDPDINSPKSTTVTADGKKIYVNSLEGGKTVVYDAATRKKLKVIQHSFDSGKGPLWLEPSGYYNFTHYPDGANRSFMGKPVEEAVSRDSKYMFVPYYRRTFDINAQDPSALAVIDTEKDDIIMMTETGPLPKMVAVSNDGNLLAITHWGNNTVGFMDISNKNPRNWKHLPPVVIEKELPLNYSLTTPVDRDSGSGFALRGTVFLPGDSILLVSGMGGPLAVVDLKKMEWIGMIPQLSRIRHITMKGDKLYMSSNATGEIMTIPVENILKAVRNRSAGSKQMHVEGIRSAKVGGGARTLKVSPSGKYIFVACNTASAIYIVREEDMKVIGRINADSFPVGLDISPDGTLLVSTSQGRKGRGGGNAVNFFKIEYADSATEESAFKAAAFVPGDNNTNAAVEEDSQSTLKDSPEEDNGGFSALWIFIIALAVVGIGAAIFLARKKSVV